jgi:(4S)-4-hydroxy-5-phosphonooxypentane-2,3-dione isomerase
MKTIIVHIRVIGGKEGEFVAATLENVACSLREPGILRFELLQDEADPSRFVLVEGYRDAAAQAAHKETAHYAAWKGLAEPMMAEPRTRAIYSTLDSGSGGTEK